MGWRGHLRLFRPAVVGLIAAALAPLAGCGLLPPEKRIESLRTWVDGQKICFLMKVSAGARHRITVIVSGVGDPSTSSFIALGGSTHRVCRAIPGMTGPTTLVTADVYGSDPDRPAPFAWPTERDQGAEWDQQQWTRESKTWDTHAVAHQQPVGTLSTTPPPIPAGAIDEPDEVRTAVPPPPSKTGPQ
jgi:hypothetical protein